MNGTMPRAGEVTHDWPAAASSRPGGTAASRRGGHVSFRVWTVLLPALVVFAAEVLRHEVLPQVLHDAVPEMLGNVLTGLSALVISAVILVPIYRRLEAADAQLRATQVAQAVLAERDRLARELHDGVAQALFFLNVKAVALERSLAPGGGEPDAIAAEIARAVQETSTRVRDAIFDLRTGPEPGLPLNAWIRTYVQPFGELHGLGGDVREHGRVRELMLEQQLHAMAIVREALHNVAKHAHARAFTVLMDWRPDELVIVVSDDGRGLPSDLPGPAQGRYGVAALSEHAHAAGGIVALAAGPDEAGTAVTFRMPYYSSSPGRA
jgi:signal transduction histidine kinase